MCLATYLGTGNIVAYSLPSLKPLIDIDFLPLVDVRCVYLHVLRFVADVTGKGSRLPSTKIQSQSIDVLLIRICDRMKSVLIYVECIVVNVISCFCRIARTLTFSTNGHGLYLSSPSEISKFTISSDSRETIANMAGLLFQAKEMPEPPKQSFFKGLFAGGPSMLDREELCT